MLTGDIDVLTGDLVARTYRLRWEVEQCFNLAKSGSGLHDMPSTNERIPEPFIYAALCQATVSMRGATVSMRGWLSSTALDPGAGRDLIRVRGEEAGRWLRFRISGRRLRPSEARQRT